MSTSSIDATLTERGNRYGEFTDHARITQRLKRAMVDSPKWAALSDDKKEALEMTVHKIGRILNGDPEYIDSWHDIIGYIRLVEKNLEAAEAAKPGPGNWLPGSDDKGLVQALEAAGLLPEVQVVSAMPDGMLANHFCDITGTMEPGYSCECRHCHATSSQKEI